MANIAASDVTYSLLKKRKDQYVTVNASLAFGNSVLTYPAGGVPVSIGNLGLPNWVETLVIYSGGTGGLSWNYDRTNQKLIATQGGSHSHDLLLVNAPGVGSAVSGAVLATTNKLGCNTGTNITVSGVQVSGGGGVVANSAGVGAEPTGLAIPAQTLLVVATGW